MVRNYRKARKSAPKGLQKKKRSVPNVGFQRKQPKTVHLADRYPLGQRATIKLNFFQTGFLSGNAAHPRRIGRALAQLSRFASS